MLLWYAIIISTHFLYVLHSMLKMNRAETQRLISIKCNPSWLFLHLQSIFLL